MLVRPTVEGHSEKLLKKQGFIIVNFPSRGAAICRLRKIERAKRALRPLQPLLNVQDLVHGLGLQKIWSRGQASY